VLAFHSGTPPFCAFDGEDRFVVEQTVFRFIPFQ